MTDWPLPLSRAAVVFARRGAEGRGREPGGDGVPYRGRCHRL